MSDLKFKDIDEVVDSLRKVRIEKTDEMTDGDVNFFCDWICTKASEMGFKVRDITKDGNREMD
jgi:hypothetical protein